MTVDDIARLVKSQLMRQGNVETDTGRLVLTESGADQAVASIAAELAARISRPVVTITRQDVLQAAAYAGYPLQTQKLPNASEIVVPVDANGVDVFEQVHKVSDFFVRVMLERMPEAILSKASA